MRHRPGMGLRTACLAGLLLLFAACSAEPFVVWPKPRDQSIKLDPSDPRVSAIPIIPPVKVRQTAPSFGRPLNLGQFDYDDRPLVFGLCYSSQLNTPAQLVSRARALCPQGGKVTLMEQDAFFNDCSLFQPHRANFLCIPGPAPEQKYK